MPLVASAKGGATSTPAPTGTHLARCVRVIDLGMQASDGQFGPKVQPKVMLTFELPLEKHVFNPEKGEEPFVVSREYTLNLGDKANLRKDLESWRGRPFTEAELEGFDVGKLLGVPCMLNVVHKSGAKGGTYANIAAISPVMRGMICPDAILPLVLYDVDQRENSAFKALPEWIQGKIRACENWKERPSAEQLQHEQADAAAAEQDGEEEPPF